MALVTLMRDNVMTQSKKMKTPTRPCELRYWYKEAKKVFPELPDWEERFAVGALIDFESIMLDVQGTDITVCIARKIGGL